MPLTHHSFPLKEVVLPGPYEADVWLVDVSAMPMMVAHPKQEISAHGLVNAKRDLRIRQQFFIRLVLGRYLGRPGKDIELEKNRWGKPSVKGASIHISLSHSRHWLALAVSTTAAVGVDIETQRALKRAKALARRCFSDEEANAIDTLAESEASSVFLERWTKTEALVKAQGESLAHALKTIRFSYPSQQLLSCPRHWPAPAQWFLSPLIFDAPITGAIACAEPISQIHLKQLSC